MAATNIYTDAASAQFLTEMDLQIHSSRLLNDTKALIKNAQSCMNPKPLKVKKES